MLKYTKSDTADFFAADGEKDMQLIGNSWDNVLEGEFSKSYFARLTEAVDEEYATKIVYPPKTEIYSAFKNVPYEAVKVVILGQDPYHGAGQANGMAFAVGKGVPLPPSLVNIFKEIEDDTGKAPKGSTLTGWAKQGVLLLNTVLTVRQGQPQSHAGYGWQQFTDAVISSLAKRETPMVFMLWGANAINKKPLIGTRHLILESVHPSPLSAYRGFFGCRHFSKANEYLRANGLTPIDWSYVDDIADELSPYYGGNGKIFRA